MERIANHLKDVLNQQKMEVAVERIPNQAKFSLLAIGC